MLNRKKITLSMLGGVCLVCLICGGAFAATDKADWTRETPALSFDGMPENTAVSIQTDVNVQNFVTKSGSDNNSTIGLGEFLQQSIRGNQPRTASSGS